MVVNKSKAFLQIIKVLFLLKCLFMLVGCDTAQSDNIVYKTGDVMLNDFGDVYDLGQNVLNSDNRLKELDITLCGINVLMENNQINKAVLEYIEKGEKQRYVRLSYNGDENDVIAEIINNKEFVSLTMYVDYPLEMNFEQKSFNDLIGMFENSYPDEDVISISLYRLGSEQFINVYSNENFITDKIGDKTGD